MTHLHNVRLSPSNLYNFFFTTPWDMIMMVSVGGQGTMKYHVSSTSFRPMRVHIIEMTEIENRGIWLTEIYVENNC